MSRFKKVKDRQSLEKLIDTLGILPFFSNNVPGWSLEELSDSSIWFTSETGPWEWKGELSYEKKCVYGKMLRNKSAFISPAWFGDLANWRRGGMSFDERVEAGLVPRQDILLVRYLREHPYTQSRYVKRECGFSEGYDAVLTRLEMQTYVVNQDFQYSVDRHGRPYGWGNAVLCLAEDWAGEALKSVPEGREPEESFERMIAHLKGVLGADEDALRRELR